MTPGTHVLWSAYPGVVFYVAPGGVVDGRDEDGEPVYRDGWAPVVMVGDDRTWEAEVSELVALGEDEPVCECGQLGCGWHGQGETE